MTKNVKLVKINRVGEIELFPSNIVSEINRKNSKMDVNIATILRMPTPPKPNM